ncbi:BgTH12-00150 [Blumeria graminis f. sp. triticale]|uniref:Gluconokinase n=3 Tax=Blumeria graminis TaxID=34373 RepID=A0A381L264_BLUGR|nr:hypothetical protein BGT96224_3688 [Blumeria graminis f. sp. tritici 96224]CAD6504643.1 BgTH12-00150 [Blumeria graminis f. sp. triticale]VDB92673.1 Bgt-3688 [Blumeria graminis f. sp. tritici]
MDQLDSPASVSLSSATSNSKQFIWLLTGPAGCGKSTIGMFLAQAMNLPYIEGDEFHSTTNIEKMSQGIPLKDADRWDWLASLRSSALQFLAAGHPGVVLSCSALKRKYRDVIRAIPYLRNQVSVYFFYLDAPEDVLLARVQSRKGHFMGPEMITSQLSIWEPPDEKETDIFRVNVNRPVDQVKEDVLKMSHNLIHYSLKVGWRKE